MLSISFIPGQAAESLRKPTNLISIADPGSDFDYRVEHKRLLSLRFEDASDMTDTDMQVLFEFVQECESAGEEIVVHCQYGQCRSPAIAKFIEDNFNYKIVGHPKSKNDTRYMDKVLHHTLGINWLRASNKSAVA